MAAPTTVGTPAKLAVAAATLLAWRRVPITISAFAGAGLLFVAPTGVFNPDNFAKVLYGAAPAVTLTLSAATVGTGRTVLASGAAFAGAGDIGKSIATSAGLGLITACPDSTHCTIDISQAFAGTSLTSTNWMIGTPLTHKTGALNAQPNSDGTGQAVDIWSLQGIVAGSGDVGVVSTNSGQFSGCFAVVMQNVDPVNPLPDAPVLNQRTTGGGTPPQALGVVTADADSAVFSIWGVLDQANTLAPAGAGVQISTRDFEAANTGVSFVAQLNTAVNPNPSVTWSPFNSTTGDYSAVGVRIQGVSAGGGVKLPTRINLGLF